MISLDDISYKDVIQGITARVRQRRLELNLTQQVLALRSGIKLPTYRKFEHTGKISVEGLLKIAFVLDALDDFKAQFAHRQYASICDVINESATTTPKRGKIK